MANMLDYLDWYGDLGFDVIPFNEVDNLILAQLAYLDLTGVVPAPPAADAAGTTPEGLPRRVSLAEAARLFAKAHDARNPVDLGALISPQTAELFYRAARAGKRFSTVQLSCASRIYDAERHEQFGAFVAELPDGTAYVSFEGTDGTLVGWLEDCEISYRVVPAQEDALLFLERAAAHISGPLRVGGHSKGGNLAAFAAATCEDAVRDRIIEVWCNDSPGFEGRVVPLELLETIADRLRLFTPEYSVVGALFSHVVPAVVIKSSDTGVMQHSAMGWQVMRGRFVRGAQLPMGSQPVNEAFDRLILTHDLAGRKKLLDNLYRELSAAGIDKVDDMFANGAQGIVKMLGSVNSLDDEDRKSMTDFLTGILAGTVQGAMVDAVAPVAKQAAAAMGEAAHSARANAAKAIEEFRAQQHERAARRRDERDQ